MFVLEYESIHCNKCPSILWLEFISVSHYSERSSWEMMWCSMVLRTWTPSMLLCCHPQILPSLHDLSWPLQLHHTHWPFRKKQKREKYILATLRNLIHHFHLNFISLCLVTQEGLENLVLISDSHVAKGN